MRPGWTEREDLCVRELYPLHGTNWDRWGEFLPGRSVPAIAARARKLGVQVGPAVVRERREVAAAASNRAQALQREAESEAAPEVMRLMHEGIAPSEIDGRLGLAPGTAVRAATRAWREDAERSKEDKA